MQTIKIGVREAKIHLSKLLEEVKRGREIIITNHGRPVGKIVPLSQKSLSLENRIQQLERQRLIEPKDRSQKKRLPPPLPVPKETAQK